MPEIFRSSRQASQIYGLSGAHPPRPKNLFYVQFNRGTDTANPTAASVFQSDLSFLVKSCDRPQIQPTTEDLNQYNKRRQVYTGVKYNPLKIVFHDTTDSLAQRMWADYVSYYFGAFGHDAARANYDYDVTIQDANTGLAFKGMNDGEGSEPGWGFAPKAAYATNTDVNAHFYFRSISIFEVWGNYYTRYDIMNPRITAFDPDGMSYEDAQIGTINMSVAYEGVIYANGGNPQLISTVTDSSIPVGGLQAAFASGGTLDGDTVDYNTASGTDTAPVYADYVYASATAQKTPYLVSSYATVPFQSVETQPYLLDASSLPALPTAGSIATYGDYVFGATQSGSTTNSQSDLLGAISTNSVLANALNVAAAQTASSQTRASTVTTSTQVYNTDTVNAAVAAVQAVSGKTTVNTSFYQQKLAAGALSAATGTVTIAREQVFTQNPLVVPSPNSWSSSTSATNGIALSASAYGAINSQRPSSSQLGFNTRTFRNQSG